MEHELIRAIAHALGLPQGPLASSVRNTAAQGRDGDTMLAHVNPREVAMLRAAGGRGTVNPSTGLTEFADGGGGGSANGGGALGGASGGPNADPRGESTAGPGGNVGSPTSPGGAVDLASGGGSSLWDTVSRIGKDAMSIAPVIMSGGASLVSPFGGLLAALSSGDPVDAIPGVAFGKGAADLLSLAFGPFTGDASQALGPDGPQGADLNAGQNPYGYNASPTAASGASLPPGTNPVTGINPNAPYGQQYSTPQPASATSALNPALQAALLYARG